MGKYITRQIISGIIENKKRIKKKEKITNKGVFKIKNIKRKQNILNNLKIIISILCLSILSTILTEENFLNVVRAEYEGEVGTVNQSGNDNDWVTENFDDIQIPDSS